MINSIRRLLFNRARRRILSQDVLKKNTTPDERINLIYKMVYLLDRDFVIENIDRNKMNIRLYSMTPTIGEYINIIQSFTRDIKADRKVVTLDNRRAQYQLSEMLHDRETETYVKTKEVLKELFLAIKLLCYALVEKSGHEHGVQAHNARVSRELILSIGAFAAALLQAA